MPDKILFDGRFLSLSHAGIGRYSCELFKSILLLDKKQPYILLVMPKVKFEKELLQAMNERETPVEVIETTSAHYTVAEQFTLLGILKELKPALVHFPHFNHPVFYKGKFVVTIHDLTLSQYAERGSMVKRIAYNSVIRRAAKNATKVLTVSEYVKGDLISTYKIPPKKIVTTYNGIDEKFKVITNPASLRRVSKYGLDKPYILSVGQWRSHKNLLRLVDAFYDIAKNSDWAGKLDLVFVGKIDRKYPELPHRVMKLKLQNDVKFTGFVEDEDLPIIYNNAKAFVFPSLAEGFGLPGLEAQACGIPLISSDRTSLPEIYGKGALYFNPENIVDMTNKILKVLNDDKFRRELIERGEQNAKRFSWQKTAKKTLEVYREIVYK